MTQETLEPGCVFCQRISRGEYTSSSGLVVAFEPLRPVTKGHLLVVPAVHVRHALEEPSVTGVTFSFAAELARGMVTDQDTAINLITSAGASASQTVFHFHVHIVPRHRGDGLKLPWTDQP